MAAIQKLLQQVTIPALRAGAFTQDGAYGLNGVDVPEWQLPQSVLAALLQDHTTGRNIFWGTKDYERQYGEGKGFGEFDEITVAQLIDKDHPVRTRSRSSSSR